MQRPDGNGRSLTATWVIAVLLAALSLIIFPAGVYMTATILFSGFRPFEGEGAIVHLVIMLLYLAPLGLFYWLFWGAVVTFTKKGARLKVALLGFLGMILASSVVIRLLF